MELRKITYSKSSLNKKQWYGIDATLNENDDVSACYDKLKEIVNKEILKV